MFSSAMTLLGRRDGDGVGSYLELAELIYRLKSAEARKVVMQVRSAVRQWRAAAQSIGLPRAELQRIEIAFREEPAG